MSTPRSRTARPRARRGTRPLFGSLRAQFALVIGLLSFLPNLLVAVMLARFSGFTNFGFVVVWMVVVALVSSVVGYALSNALVRPLTRLTSELHRGGLGDAHHDDPEEVRSLRGAFSRLLSRLAQERDRRNAFMATLVHDLKTPLIATSHLVGVLRDVPIDDADRAGIYTQLLDENGRLLHLVQQMADAHRFEREGVQLSRAEVSLRDIAEEACARLRPRAHDLALALGLHGEGVAHADALQLDRGLTNLLDNALRYARSAVRVELRDDLVRVLNDGPPLSEPLSKLAQPFNSQPVEIAGHRYTAGTAGLGLFIVRRIAEAHGGELRYVREGDWSVFEIRLADASQAPSRVGGVRA